MKPPQVAPLLGLELARHPHQLAHVGHPPCPGGQREDVAVVAGLADGSVHERLERLLRSRAPLGLEQPHEAFEPAPVLSGQVVRQPVGLGDRPPDVAPGLPGVQADQRHGVERQPAQRRGKHAVHGQLVERVREGGQPVAQVGHLLLGPVAAPADHVRGDAALLESALVEAHARGRAEQQHDVAPLPSALRRELLDPLRQEARLGGPPGSGAVHRGPKGIVDAERLVPAFLVLVGHEQLDARRRSRRIRTCPVVLAQRLEVSAPGLLKATVDRLEHLAAAAEVDRDALRPAGLDRGVPVAAEHADVRVAKAVDRLALVPDPKQVVALELSEQLVLERIGVLELVDEHVGESLGVLEAQALVGREQVARDQLEVLEVEPRPRALAVGVAVAVELEQHAQHRVVVVFALPAAEALVGAERRAVLVADGRAERVGVLPDRQLLEIVGVGQLTGRHPLEHGRAALEPLDRRGDALSRSGPRKLGERGAHRGLEPLGLARDARRLRFIEARAASAAAAQSRVGGAHHVTQAVGRVGRDHLEALGLPRPRP